MVRLTELGTLSTNIGSHKREAVPINTQMDFVYPGVSDNHLITHNVKGEVRHFFLLKLFFGPKLD